MQGSVEVIKRSAPSNPYVVIRNTNEEKMKGGFWVNLFGVNGRTEFGDQVELNNEEGIFTVVGYAYKAEGYQERIVKKQVRGDRAKAVQLIVFYAVDYALDKKDYPMYFAIKGFVNKIGKISGQWETEIYEVALKQVINENGNLKHTGKYVGYDCRVGAKKKGTTWRDDNIMENDNVIAVGRILLDKFGNDMVQTQAIKKISEFKSAASLLKKPEPTEPTHPPIDQPPDAEGLDPEAIDHEVIEEQINDMDDELPKNKTATESYQAVDQAFTGLKKSVKTELRDSAARIMYVLLQPEVRSPEKEPLPQDELFSLAGIHDEKKGKKILKILFDSGTIYEPKQECYKTLG